MFLIRVRDKYLQRTFTLYNLSPIEMSLVFQRNWFFFEMSIVFNQEGEWSILKVIIRTTLQQTQVYEISICVQIEILNNFICGDVEECLSAYKVSTENFGYYKLQYDIMRKSLSHVASLLWNNYSFFTHEMFGFLKPRLKVICNWH